MIKTHIPARPRNKKIVPTGGASISPSISSAVGSSHTHNNKSLLDLINQGNMDVLSKLFVDESDNLYTTQNFYSQKEVSAYGIGSGGGGGGTEYILPTASTTTLGGIKVGNGLTISSGVLSVIGGGGGSTVTWGTESGGYIPLTVEGVSKSVALSTHNHSGVYAPVTHNHSGVYEPVFSKNTAFNKDFGTTSGTVAQGNDSRIVNGQTAYGWGNHASAGYALNTALTAHINKVDNPHAVTTAQIGAVDLTTNQTIGGVKTFAGNVTAPTFEGSISTPRGVEYLTTLNANLTAAGWYRVFVSNMENALGSSVILNVNRSFTYDNNESYTFSINVAYNGAISITQLSGRANQRVISKIRVDYVNSGVLAVDIYYSLNSSNGVYISGSGTGKFQVPALVTAPTGTTAEFDTVNGVKSNLGFTGDLTGNASSATKLQNTRTIWGQSFDGTGNVTGALTGATTITASTSVTAPTITASTSVTTPKVIFAAAGWSLEQSGTELQMKYNGVAKLRFLSGGSIVATSEITAYS